MATDTPAIRTEGLVKHYGRIRAVDGVDLIVPKGAVYGLIGPNGAGKTTTFSLVCGWVRPSSGHVEVLSESPTRVARLKGRLSALPQDAALPPSVPLLQSLTYYARLQGLSAAEARAEATRQLEAVGLGNWGRVRASSLSHGMAKRAGLAQAFLGSPELVLLDEPTAGLDPKSAHNVRSLIETLRGKATVVVSSHNLFELEALCDHAAILDRGRVVVQGPMAELTASDTEIVVSVANDPKRAVALAQGLEQLPEVASSVFDAGGRRILVRIRKGPEPIESVITPLLRQLIEQGALIGAVTRGKGLERRVLELT